MGLRYLDMMFPWAWITVLGLQVGCQSCHPLPVPPEIGPEPAFDDAGAPLDACSLACRHLRALKCPDGARTLGGASCEAACRASLPPVGGTDPVCLQHATTCDQEATCTVP